MESDIQEVKLATVVICLSQQTSCEVKEQGRDWLFGVRQRRPGCGHMGQS